MLGGWGTLTVRIGTIVALAIGLALTACAGRDPQPVATVQPQDATSDCAMITAEISANNTKFAELSNEEGLKVGQNVAAGVAGIVIWPLWFAMDFKGAASKEVVALQARQQYLTSLATQRCAPPPPVAAVAAPAQHTAHKSKSKPVTPPQQAQPVPASMPATAAPMLRPIQN